MYDHLHSLVFWLSIAYKGIALAMFFFFFFWAGLLEGEQYLIKLAIEIAQ